MVFDTLILNLTIVNDYIKTFSFNIEEYSVYFFEAFNFLKNHYDRVADSFISPITFTEFQLNILKVFLIILVINILLIIIYWRKYGNVITDRFIRPSTLKEIEELKLSVARLKLPKEHSWRL